MKNLYLALLFCFTFCSLNAQIVNIPDYAFKQILLTENVVDTTGDAIGDTNIDVNNDGEIQTSEALSVISLVIPNNEYTNPVTNEVTYILDITGLEAFSNMQILVVDTSLNNSNNSPNITIDLGTNNQSLVEIKMPDFRGLSNFDLGFKPNLETLEMLNVIELNSIDLSECSNLNTLHLGMTNLIAVDVTQNTNMVSLSFDSFAQSSIDLSQNEILETLSFSYPFGLNTLDVSNNINLTSLTCIGADQLTSLDLSHNINLQNLTCYQGFVLENINIKNGGVLTNLDFSYCDSLTSICVDNQEFDLVSNLVTQYGYTNCTVTNYCNLDPGGSNYTVQGESLLDIDNNGCDINDLAYKNLKFNISNGTSTSVLFADDSGNYDLALYDGVSVITPALENSNYFIISPSSITVDFPTDTNPYNQDFCITPNGIHNDLEVTIVPVQEARPGFNTDYKVVYKNKGGTTLSGSVDFIYADTAGKASFVSASVIPDSNLNAVLSWNYLNLLPLETREIEITMSLNTPTDPNAPLNGGDILSYTSRINPIIGDETEIDNTFALRQTVVNSFDPNDKTCLEGHEIELDRVGDFVHYMIRFENTGTASAINIVVKDSIDDTKYDMASLVPVHASHNFVTRIQNSNEVEFIFENINLPFDDANNDGYVVFKIKTISTLVIGDTFSNDAEIYFDFNFPIITNDELTTVIANNLSVSEFSSAVFKIHPNPVHDVLTINSNVVFDSLSIFNINGQLVKEITLDSNPSNKAIHVKDLQEGVYFIKVKSKAGVFVKKIIKI